MFPCSLRDLVPDVLIEDKIEVACEHDVLRPARKTGPLTRELYWQIGECGWLGSAYPKEYGGQLSKFIAEEEFIRAGVSIDLGVSGARHSCGGDRRAEAMLRPQTGQPRRLVMPGFSEPHAGTGLSSLHGRAIPTAEGYVINGQDLRQTRIGPRTSI
ncbi:acyl-CoA dehydrogenase family protein [Paraburkholderia sediminicola]|uniref:acyl-CoA dehydrogenase family protein n=1 Tax=Paraburkholderia sediminicola TaxID=458836 RepID=UPI0038BC20C2